MLLSKRFQCPHCGARRGLAYDTQGKSWCFSCHRLSSGESFRIKSLSWTKISESINSFPSSNLFKYLSKHYNGKLVSDTAARLFVGGSPKDPEKVVFFYFQYEPNEHKLKPLKAKISRYDTSGKRLGSYTYPKGLGMPSPPFGIEQIHGYGENNPNLPVIFVESEKAAFIGSMIIPKAVWLATGGASNRIALTDDQIDILSGHEVLVMFDNDEAGRKGASKIVRYLRSYGISAYDFYSPDYKHDLVDNFHQVIEVRNAGSH